MGFNVFNRRIFSANAAGTLVEGVVPNAEGRSDLPEDAKDVVVVIKPQDIALSLTKDAFEPRPGVAGAIPLARWWGQVYMEGLVAKVYVYVGDVSLKAYVSPKQLEELDIKPGCPVFLHVKSSKVKVLPKA